MQILLIGPWPRLWGPGNFQWLSDTARALKRLGHRVRVVRYQESWTVSPKFVRRMESISVLPGWMARYRAVQQRAQERSLITLARNLRPDLILILNGEALPPHVLAEVKRFTPGQFVNWWVDDPCAYPSFMKCAMLFDHLFVFDRAYIPRLKAAGAEHVYFLPCACDETIYQPHRLSPAEQRRFGCDIAFVGWYYPERAPVVKALAETDGLQVGVWGGQWDTPEARRALRGANVMRGRGVDGRTAVKIYSASKIGLNVHAKQSVLSGLNMRTFELLASGLFQLVDYIKGMEELLVPDQEVVCYSSPEEAKRLAKHYVDDPVARTRIAARGRARVLEEHTYVARMRTLCDVARESSEGAM